jgi:hypothetical protein
MTLLALSVGLHAFTPHRTRHRSHMRVRVRQVVDLIARQDVGTASSCVDGDYYRSGRLHGYVHSQ